MTLRATFSEREWWKRIWVVQEVVSARDARIVCGGRTISWSRLDKILHGRHGRNNIVLVKRPRPNVQEQLANTMHSAILFTAIRDQIHNDGLKTRIAGGNTYKMSLCSLLALFEGAFARIHETEFTHYRTSKESSGLSHLTTQNLS
jgi:hypothetical protein